MTWSRSIIPHTSNNIHNYLVLHQHKLHMLSVIEKKYTSVNMLCLTLQGKQLEDAVWKPGCYVKLMIPDGEKMRMRTYTARSFDPQRQSIDIEFAIHYPAGPATRWALDAQIGDEIEIKGPGHLRIDPTQGDWYLFAADMSALPAMISIMESLPAHAKGYAFFEVMDAQDKQEVKIQADIEIEWFIHPNPKERSPRQLQAIQSLTLLEGTPTVIMAGELGTIREIRQYLTEAEPFKDAHMYMSSYWKIGSNEEEHKQAKRLMRR